jgi:hypothetical protein
MKRILTTLAAVLCAMALSAQEITHLKTVNSLTQLIVDGKPFIMLSGELHNSTCIVRIASVLNDLN